MVKFLQNHLLLNLSGFFSPFFEVRTSNFCTPTRHHPDPPKHSCHKPMSTPRRDLLLKSPVFETTRQSPLSRASGGTPQPALQQKGVSDHYKKGWNGTLAHHSGWLSAPLFRPDRPEDTHWRNKTPPTGKFYSQQISSYSFPIEHPICRNPIGAVKQVAQVSLVCASTSHSHE